MSQQQNLLHPLEPVDDFEKRLVLHMIVMERYTVISFKGVRMEFNHRLTAGNIATVLSVVQNRLNEIFLNVTQDSSCAGGRSQCAS